MSIMKGMVRHDYIDIPRRSPPHLMAADVDRGDPIMTEQNDERSGVWGAVGKEDEEVHWCVPGQCLIGVHPELAVNSKKYLKPGTLWEVYSHENGKYRQMRLRLPKWNPDNPRTCPKCKRYFEMLQEQKSGLTKA